MSKPLEDTPGPAFGLDRITVWCEGPTRVHKPRCVAQFVYQILRDAMVEGRPLLRPNNRWILDDSRGLGRWYGPGDPARRAPQFVLPNAKHAEGATTATQTGWRIRCACGQGVDLNSNKMQPVFSELVTDEHYRGGEHEFRVSLDELRRLIP